MRRIAACLLTLVVVAGARPADASNDALRGDSVETSTGLFERHSEDVNLPGTPAIVLWRSYMSGRRWEGPFGVNTTHNYELQLWPIDQAWSVVGCTCTSCASPGGRVITTAR